MLWKIQRGRLRQTRPWCVRADGASSRTTADHSESCSTSFQTLYLFSADAAQTPTFFFHSFPFFFYYLFFLEICCCFKLILEKLNSAALNLCKDLIWVRSVAAWCFFFHSVLYEKKKSRAAFIVFDFSGIFFLPHIRWREMDCVRVCVCVRVHVLVCMCESLCLCVSSPCSCVGVV